MKTNVAVIGAGASGLAAAYFLAKRGLSVSIYEALDRIGGRIYSTQLGDAGLVEMGAESINGSWHRLLRWARKNGVRLIRPQQSVRDYYVVDGELIDERAYQANPVAREVEQLWGKLSVYRGSERTADEFLSIENASSEARAIIAHQMAELTSSVMQLSVLGARELLSLGEAVEANIRRPRGPYLNVFNHVIESLKNGIYTRTRVSAVELGHNGVKLVLDEREEQEVECVVVTTPLGSLKRAYVTFSPELPEQKRAAIDRLGFTQGVKIALLFTGRFWPDDLDYLTGLPSGIFWPPQVTRGGGAAILMLYSVGSHAEYLGSLRDLTPVQSALADLDAVFDGAASRSYVQSEMQDWTAEPSIGGYFTSPTSASYLQDKGILAQPIENRVFFAGEATNQNLSSMGYVHGAVATGIRAAREVLRSR